jgi:hypothetical protein
VRQRRRAHPVLADHLHADVALGGGLFDAACAAECRAGEGRLVSGSGNALGDLKSASQGVFQIAPAYSTEVSSYGENDTSSIDFEEGGGFAGGVGGGVVVVVGFVFHAGDVVEQATAVRGDAGGRGAVLADAAIACDQFVAAGAEGVELGTRPPIRQGESAPDSRKSTAPCCIRPWDG